MRVFKGYMILMKRNLGLILLYFGVFVGIAVMIQTSAPKTDGSTFSLSSMKITVIDRDGGELAQGLRDYLGVNNKMIDFADEKDVLRDALYYRKTEFIIYVPQNFEEKCFDGNEKLGITAVPGSYTESYVSYQVDAFINQVKTYQKSGYTMEEAIANTVKLQEIQPEVTVLAGSNAEMPGYMYAFRYFPYLFLASLCSTIGMLLVIFRKENVKERISCAPVSSARRTGEMVLALSVISIGLWVISLAIPIAQSGGEVLKDVHLPYLIVNSFLLLLSCMGIAVITGTLVKSSEIITNVATTLSLGISFLSGVFVPLEMMGNDVKKVVQVLPVYWYEVINDLLGNYQTLTGSMKTTMYKGFIVQIVFAIACVCVAMLISKMQEEK